MKPRLRRNEQKSNYSKKERSGGVIRPQAVHLNYSLLHCSVCVHTKTCTSLSVRMCVYKTVCAVIVVCVCLAAVPHLSPPTLKLKANAAALITHTERPINTLRPLGAHTALRVSV